MNVPETFRENQGPANEVKIHFPSTVAPCAMWTSGPTPASRCVSESTFVSVSRNFSTENCQLQKHPYFPGPSGLPAVDGSALTPPAHLSSEGTCVEPPQSTDHRSLCSSTISWLGCHPVLPGRMSPTLLHWTPQASCWHPRLWQWLRQVWGVPSLSEADRSSWPSGEPEPMFPEHMCE